MLNFVNELTLHATRQVESEEISPENLKRQFKATPTLSGRKLVPVCAPNSFGTALYGLEPLRTEYVVEKYTYDAFSNLQVKRILKKRQIRTVVVTGVNTDICIDTTVRRAFTEGYNIIVPKDLVATMNKKGEKYYLTIFDTFFGSVVNSKHVLQYLRLHPKILDN